MSRNNFGVRVPFKSIKRNCVYSHFHAVRRAFLDLIFFVTTVLNRRMVLPYKVLELYFPT